jgi:hypothetical protein
VDGGGVVAARRKSLPAWPHRALRTARQGPRCLTPESLPVEYDDAAIAAYFAEYVDDSDGDW